MPFPPKTTDRGESPLAVPEPRRLPVYRKHGVLISTLLHLAAIFGLLAASVRPRHDEDYRSHRTRALYVVTELADADDPRELPLVAMEDNTMLTGPAIRDRIQEHTDSASGRSDEENLERLEELSDRLNEVSGESSIDRMAGALQRVLGTRPRVDRPKGFASSQTFDVDTAQFHDVRREATDTDSWRYICILIDAQGCLFEVEMNVEDGRRLYEMMQRIKQNPLLERVYRRIAIPLMDRMIDSARETAVEGRTPEPIEDRNLKSSR